MRATVSLDDELVSKAQELSGVMERTTLLRNALGYRDENSQRFGYVFHIGVTSP